ncbi:hypothetical protein Tco_0266628 [Tanacetum coccineum]
MASLYACEAISTFCQLDISQRIGPKSLTMRCGHLEPPIKHLLDALPLAAAKNHFMELNELMELRDGAYENTRIYKERTKKWHDSRLRGDKDFKVGDKDLAEKKSTMLVKYLQSGILAH